MKPDVGYVVSERKQITFMQMTNNLCGILIMASLQVAQK